MYHKQHTDGIALSAVRSKKKRSLPRRISCLDTGLVIQQQLHALDIVVKGSHVQGCPAPVIAQVHYRRPKVRDQQFQTLFTSLETVSQSQISCLFTQSDNTAS